MLAEAIDGESSLVEDAMQLRECRSHSCCTVNIHLLSPPVHVMCMRVAVVDGEK
jgi:hypothetical protein